HLVGAKVPPGLVQREGVPLLLDPGASSPGRARRAGRGLQVVDDVPPGEHGPSLPEPVAGSHPVQVADGSPPGGAFEIRHGSPYAEAGAPARPTGYGATPGDGWRRAHEPTGSSRMPSGRTAKRRGSRPCTGSSAGQGQPPNPVSR